MNKKILFALFFILLLTPVSFAYWDYYYTDGINFTVNSSLIDEVLTDFPILITLNSTTVDYASTQNSGQDIRFISAIEGTNYEYEIELWNETGNSYVWVKIPTVSNTSDTTFYMYYGNEYVTDDQDATNVWDSNYLGVWHISETGTGTRYDSTSNSNDATPTDYDGDEATTGKIDGADDLDGTSDYIHLTDDTFNSETAGTISAWIKTDDSVGTNIIFGASNTQNKYASRVWFRVREGLLEWFVDNSAGTDLIELRSSTLMNDSTLHFVSVTVDASNTYLYVDGVEDVGTNTTCNTTCHYWFDDIGGTGDTKYDIGAVWYDPQSLFFNGTLDEVRLSDTGRSAAWVKAEYYSEINGLLSEDILDTDRYYINGKFNYKIDLTINSSLVDEVLTDFPVLVTLNSTYVNYSNIQNAGQDIRFLNDDEDTELSYEIELWNESGDSFVWVKIPTISNTSDTIFYMYFDNSLASDNQNVTGVWDDNFIAVYHNNDLTTSTIKDSTGVNNGTKVGANEPIEKTGYIGNAQYFDGSNDYITASASLLLAGENESTVESWIYPEGDGIQDIYSEDDTAGDVYILRYHGSTYGATNSLLKFGTYNDADGWACASTDNQTVLENTWSYLAGTFKYGDSAKAYVNGILNATILNANKSENVPGESRIGKDILTGGRFYFNGTIDELRLSDIKRSSAWIKASYYSGSDGLIADSGEVAPCFYIPKLSDLRIEEINENNITLNWSNNTEYSHFVYNITLDGSLITSGSSSGNTVTITGLIEDIDYVLNWYTNNTCGDEGSSYAINFRTEGWHVDLSNFGYKRLITVNNVTSDLENYTLNITLTDDNFNYTGTDGLNHIGFTHINYSNFQDFRLIDYYNREYLDFNVTATTMYGNGCELEQVIPNDTLVIGGIQNGINAYDDVWSTYAYPNSSGGYYYYNYTVPANTIGEALFKIKHGNEITNYTNVPDDCINSTTGTKVQFTSYLDYDNNGVNTTCTNLSNSSQEIYVMSDYSYYKLFDTQITWKYDCSLDIQVKPLHFSDTTQEYTEGLDGDYTNRLLLYYGYATATDNTTAITYDGSWDNYTLGAEQEYTATGPTISSLVNTTGADYTWFDISWIVNKYSDNRVKYSTNTWLVDPSYTSWDNDSISQDYNITSLTANITYYWEVYSEGTADGLNSTETGSIALGTLAATPTVAYLNYTEDRANENVTVCGNLTNLGGYADINISVIYWITGEESINTSAVTEVSATGTFCKEVEVDYGNTYTYVLKACNGDFCDYSDTYETEFMAVQEFFTGSYIEDDGSNRGRYYKGYHENSWQSEDWIWIETNYSTSNMVVRTWNNSNYSASKVTGWVNSSMSNNSEISYLKLENLDDNWYAFEIWNATAMVYNRTKASLQHSAPETGCSTSDCSRIDDYSYVRFNGTVTDLNYTLLYLNDEMYNLTAGKWGRYYPNGTYKGYGCSSGGGKDYMGVLWWGDNTTPYCNPVEQVGNERDRGMSFFGGVFDNSYHDSGIMQEDIPSGYGWDDAYVYGARYCYIFVTMAWNKQVTIDKVNITNYYVHQWEPSHINYYGLNVQHTKSIDLTQFNETMAEEQSYAVEDDDVWTEIDGAQMLYPSGRYLDSGGNLQTCEADYCWNPDWNDTVIGTTDDFAQDLFYMDYPQEKVGINMSVYTAMQTLTTPHEIEKDEIYDFGLYYHTDANTPYIGFTMGPYHQNFVIFNLPDNATLQGLDTDSDGLTDFEELYTYNTNPKWNDTDGDKWLDGREVDLGTNPNLWYDMNSPNVTLTVNVTEIAYGSSENISVICSAEPNIDTYLFNITYPNGTLYYEDATNGTSIILSSANLTEKGVWDISCRVNDTYNQITTETNNITVTNAVPVLTAKNLTPVTPDISDDLLVNATCTDLDVSDTITAYVQMYKDSVAFGSVESGVIINGTNTNFYNESSSNTSTNEVWIAEVWCGDATDNTSKENTTARTINEKPTIYLNSPASATTIAVDYQLINYSIYDSNNDTTNCTLYGDKNANPTTILQANNSLTDTVSNLTITYNWTSLDIDKYYWKVKCEDIYGSTTSEIRDFTIGTPPSFSAVLVNQTVVSGKQKNYTISCTGTGVITYDSNVSEGLNTSSLLTDTFVFEPFYSNIGTHTISANCTSIYGADTGSFNVTVTACTSGGGGGLVIVSDTGWIK